MTATVGLRFTDNTTTVTISNGTTGIVVEYAAKNSRADVEEIGERAKALLLGGLSTVRATIESINRLFQAARDYQLERAGVPVYVERQLDTGDAWWRSELVEAMPLPDPGALDIQHAGGKYEVDFQFVRKNWWEGAEAQIPLTNGNGTNNTSGLTIYNHDDATAGHDNWVSINAADVAGDLPAPTRLEITNGSSLMVLKDTFIGQNWTDPANFSHILEGSGTAGASYSDGSYKEVNLTTTLPTIIQTWTLSSANLVAAAGRYYLPMMRIVSGVTDNNILYWLELGDVSYGAWINPNVELGAVNICHFPVRQIPPFLKGQTSLLTMDLTLWAKTSTPTKTVKMDYIELMPIDGWRRLVQPSGTIVVAYRLIDDGINGLVYGDSTAGNNKQGYFSLYNQPILLKPNKLQRLYFLWTGAAAGANHEVDATATVKLYYRPRRLALN